MMIGVSLFLAAPSHAQSEAAPAARSLRTVLTAEEFRRAGLDKLTDEELTFLSRLLLESGNASTAAPGARLNPARPATAVAQPAPPRTTTASIAQDATEAVAPDEPATAPPEVTQGADGESAFGREDEIRREDERARRIPKAIESTIAGTFRGWSGRTTFALTNGQVWRQIEDGIFSVRLQDPRVTIEKAAMGAFYLQVEGYGSRVKVRRIK